MRDFSRCFDSVGRHIASKFDNSFAVVNIRVLILGINVGRAPAN